ncbi:AAT2 Aspartate aminotransferase [Candida maltosa Xu316]
MTDPIVRTMELFQKDTNPNKIDVSIGVYKDEAGGLYCFDVVKDAKKHLFENDPGHGYTTMAGVPAFVKSAQQVVFGDSIAQEGKLASLQAISGSGALHMGLMLLVQAGHKDFYVGTPTWSNYIPMITHVGGNVKTYEHYNADSRTVNFESVVGTLETAPSGSVFLFQTCCHNPTGADYSRDQWTKILDLVENKNHIVLFDNAYQGFASGDLDEDAWAIRHAYGKGLEFVVAQSFSKNLGLYSERVGCVHAVVQNKEFVPHTQSTLVATFRHECSFAPAYGARIAAYVIQNEDKRDHWRKEVAAVRNRLVALRQKVLDKLTELGTPGDWTNVVAQNGLFWFSQLSEDENERLIAKHVYSTNIGRVNIAGLNDANVDQFCKAIDEVVRNTV